MASPSPCSQITWQAEQPGDRPPGRRHRGRSRQPIPAEQQAIAIYRGLQKGHIDRSLLAPNLNDYFSAQTIADFRDSLGPLGEPLTFRQTHESFRGGMTFRAFSIVYPTRHLTLTTYTYPDGNLEQYLIEPQNSGPHFAS